MDCSYVATVSTQRQKYFKTIDSFSKLCHIYKFCIYLCLVYNFIIQHLAILVYIRMFTISFVHYLCITYYQLFSDQRKRIVTTYSL